MSSIDVSIVIISEVGAVVGIPVEPSISVGKRGIRGVFEVHYLDLSCHVPDRDGVCPRVFPAVAVPGEGRETQARAIVLKIEGTRGGNHASIHINGKVPISGGLNMRAVP